MVSSLDGFIARKDNSISWFETADHYEKGVEYTEEQTKEFLKTNYCYVIGART
jgi:dihydrofolate reductase